MSRVIKFRAWDKVNKRFENPQDFAVMGTGKFAIWYGQPHGYEAEKNDESRLEVTQFTGLLDKNGKEIYEGDVVRTDSGAAMYVEWRFDFACFCLRFHVEKGGSLNLDIDGANNYAVIGNIYENPHLLSDNKEGDERKNLHS